MESLDLTYKSVDLNIKSKALDQIYFMSQVFHEHIHCYDKRKNTKMKITKIYLFLLPPLPSQDEGGGGVTNSYNYGSSNNLNDNDNSDYFIDMIKISTMIMVTDL